MLELARKTEAKKSPETSLSLSYKPEKIKKSLPYTHVGFHVSRKAICPCDGGCPRCLPIQKKLRIGEPDDEYEKEADKVAEQVMRIPDPVLQPKRNCPLGKDTSCKEDEEDETKDKMLMKKEAQAHGPVRNFDVPPIVHEVLQSPGQPLDIDTRKFFEPRFGYDFSAVRVHNDAKADESAQAMNALAYTVGKDVIFRVGLYTPGRNDSKRLLAHELTHTVQQLEIIQNKVVQHDKDSSGGGKGSNGTTPILESGPESNSKTDSETANNLVKAFADFEIPKTDEERQEFKKKVITLIRYKAIEMVYAHLIELIKRKQQFEQMAVNPQGSSGISSQSQSNSSPKTADMATAIRAAAELINKLNAEKEELKESHNKIDTSVRLNAGPEALKDEYKTIWDNAQLRSNLDILQKLLIVRDRMETEELFWGSKKLILFDLRNYLTALRKMQIKGIDRSLIIIYEDFPFFADLPATDVIGKTPNEKNNKTIAFGLGLSSILVPGMMPFASYLAYETFKKNDPPNDQTLLTKVQTSFDHLTSNTVEAIGKIVYGIIDPLDLPGAVAATRNNLPVESHPELDRIQQEHEVWKFTQEMILTLGIAVLTGLTGGAAAMGVAGWAVATGAAATGLGAAQLGMQLKDMLDRQTLAAASISPDGSLLGVSAPSRFEWVMFGVGAALTAVDLASLAKEISALRPHFNEEPHMPSGNTEPRPKSTIEGEPKAPSQPEPSFAGEVSTKPGKVQPSSPSEARILEAGRGDTIPSPEHIDAELSIVERSEPQKIPGGKDYIEEVELSNGHTWKRTPEGNWCRFSKEPKICVPVILRKTGSKKVPDRVVPGLNIVTGQDIDKFIEIHRPKLESPPSSVTRENLRTWELYVEYFDDRVRSMRADISNKGKTVRDPPRTFESFKSQFDKNPELLDALRGRLYQKQTERVIDEITSGTAAHNLGISKVPDPEPNKMLYPDTVFRRYDEGYTAVSTKSRQFSEVRNEEELVKVVSGDLEEALDKYYGTRYVRRRGLDVTGEKINIDEIILNYDPNPSLYPKNDAKVKALKELIKDITETFEKELKVNVQVGFFDPRAG